MNVETLPPRIPASVVCKLAGYSKSTLLKRIRGGRMPQPVDRGREMLFNKSEVVEALGLTGEQKDAGNPWEAALNK